MSSGDRKLTKQELKRHPLRITGNLANAEEEIYKSAAFSTYCMTQGMTSDQVKTMWQYQPLFLPIQHIKGKCGLCKHPVANSFDLDRTVANIAKNQHLSDENHLKYCKQEWNDIDERLKMKVPIDVKCFLISYIHYNDDGPGEAFGSWNSVLSHILSEKHRKKVAKLLAPHWETSNQFIELVDDEESDSDIEEIKDGVGKKEANGNGDAEVQIIGPQLPKELKDENIGAEHHFQDISMKT